MSYNPCISHYRPDHAPFRLYISPEFNNRSMYRDFCESHQIKMFYSFYRSHIVSMNISFVKLGDEEWEVCDVHEKHLMEIPDLGKKDIAVKEDQSKKKQNAQL